MASLASAENQGGHAMTRDLKWSHAEKGIGHKVFERALDREFQAVIRTAKEMAGKIEQPADLWDLESYLAYGASSPNTFASAWRVSIDRGPPSKLAENLDRPRLPISPDSRMVAVRQWGKTPTSPSVLSVVSAESGKVLHAFEAPAGMQVFGWSGDGRALNYVMTRGGVGNIWEQPLTGGPAKQITHFKSELIREFDWSRDGKQVAVARGHLNSNVVLISNFH